MAIEMLTNNKKLKKIELNLHFSKTKYVIVYIIEGYLWINFQFFHLDKLSMRYE